MKITEIQTYIWMNTTASMLTKCRRIWQERMAGLTIAFL